MNRIKTMLAGVMAGTMAFSAYLAMPTNTFTYKLDVNAADDYYCHDTFESGTDDWEGRGGASVITGGTAYAGSKALTVSDRGSSWHGAQKTLDDSVFRAGEEYSFSAAVSGSGNMMLSLQYKDASGKTVYDHIADGKSSGDYVQLVNKNYKLPEGSGYILYVETETGTDDFSVDEVIIAKAGAQTGAETPAEAIQGDFNGDEVIDSFDLVSARKALISYTTGSALSVSMTAADVDGDGSFAVNDLVLLSKFILGQAKELPKPVVTTTTTTTTAPVTTTTVSAGEYMSSIRDKITVNVPSNVLKNAEGKVEHITYFSKKANRNKGANVWLPPGYDSSKKYPVFYVNHGYGGDEFTMMNGMGVREIATNLIKSGEAEPMIIVFTNQYTDPQHEKQTGNGQADVPGYDNFVEDLPDSLMPYIEEHYPVKTGRENTAVAGFSMGGRESLYIGMKCCDKVGYIGGGAPAPGIFPTKDQFMTHPGVMSKDDLRIDPPYSPYLLMIAGGTSDGMVNDFPKQYSDLFTQHGTENIYISVPGGGHDSSTVIPLMYNFIRFIFKA
ncbi:MULTISPECIES: carbohydrate binding domain-containing protein [Ruminococcus]|uniref:Enterochelin esterase n=1 Tax=Ruminococcus flavefaciens TaxID=1265 RepID=A0A1M7LMV0_RUMFL|nr:MULTISPECIES: carbohydrate binding domain-containing protein [Ruminococcus]MCR4796400.1 carbohydrate binding domain-containing protein [Ruminococcus sp.]SHM79510.1 Enterochelin esterase [Ruminococcus flavefaciens]